MKTNLFFFSATGNSLMVAKDIAAKLPGTQIFSIPKVINQPIDLTADNIGLIFPVYFTGMPKIVIDFINKLAASKTKYIFAICTCGAFPMGTLLQTQKQLETSGLTLKAGFSIKMPGNYLVKYGAYSIEKQKNLFIKERQKVETIVKIIKKQQNNKIEHNNFLINGIGNLLYKSMLPKFPTLDRNFNVDEKCNSCETCEKVCPVQNIKIFNGRPNWQGKCEHCLACIQWCPPAAIQYGTQTNDRKRYHHPEVQVKELYR
jgi:flavodoxin